MNFKTTLVLLIFGAAGGAFYWLGPTRLPWMNAPAERSATTDAGTLATLERIRADQLTGIDIQHGEKHLRLERSPGGEWTLPGRWPTRKPEVAELLGTLTALRSRFAPISLEQTPNLEPYGLDQPAVRVTLTLGQEQHTLALGEERGQSNRFSRPTYLRLDDKPEVVRLAPGLVAALDRPLDYYQQRRLFPGERVAKEGEGQEKIERLAGKTLTVKGSTSYTLSRTADEWELTQPVHDHLDPDKMRTVLTAVPDLWVEQFVDQPKKDLAEYGLKSPEQTLRVTIPSGDTITLLIGKQSQVKTRKTTRPAPNFGGPPMPPQQEIVHEEYRFAKLENNDQIFEIKADKLKDLFVAAETLRDARLARFRAEDARRVEIQNAGQSLVMTRDGDKWKIEKPLTAEAETAKITELLDKLTNLQATGKDVLDKADAKAYGLDAPAYRVLVNVEEETKGEGDAKSKKARSFTFTVGKHDAAASKLYVQLAGLERINAVEDSLLKLVERPALAYRNRKIFDFFSTDVARLDVQRAGGTQTIEQDKGQWRLTAPAKAELDISKTGQLVGDLGRLEASEFVAEAPPAADLEPKYGLGQPALAVAVSFTDAKKPAQKLLIGKERPGKAEFYAKLASAPGVFTIKKELRDSLDQDSLALRSLQLWQVAAEDIKEIRIQKQEPEYRLRRDGANWKLAGPVDAKAVSEKVQPLVTELATLRTDRFVAHTAKDLSTYGLDKPALRVAVQAEAKPPAAEPGKPAPSTAAATEHVLLIGKTTEPQARTRFAKLGAGEAIFVVSDKLVSAVDHAALEFLDRRLFAADPKSIERIRKTGVGGPLTLERQGDAWRVVGTPAPAFTADPEIARRMVDTVAKLEAERWAAYGPQVTVATYGLDQPAASITIAVKDRMGKTVEHTLALGKPAEGSTGRYARFDQGPGVAVLAPEAVAALTPGYLDLVEHSLWKLDVSNIAGLERQMKSEVLEIAKRNGDWHLIKPRDQRGDKPTIETLLTPFGDLRAQRVAAYPAKTDWKRFGLDQPTATVRLRLAGAGGKTTEKILHLGQETGDAGHPGERFARAEGIDAVVVLPASLTQRLLANALQFRDHTLAQIGAVDRLLLERGPRRAMFARLDSSWKLSQPIEADAEQADLEDFLKDVRRLRADEFVADKPADLKPYGLDHPEARWRFQIDNQEVLQLLVGRSEKITVAGKEIDGPRRYAKLASSDLVFLLSPQLTQRVMGEYRNRSIWPPLDAAQVNEVRFGYPERPFTLEKVDNDWRVQGKGSVALKQETVRETLDALAGLKAARYVVDQAADGKLYGLEPPQLVLEVQTPSGRRVLQIGRPEGESRNRYARVAEGDRPPIFIIGEADAGKIVRTLSAFTAEPTKAAARP